MAVSNLTKENHNGTNTIAVILAALLAVSEALALIPSIKANSVFQLVVNILGKLAGK